MDALPSTKKSSCCLCHGYSFKRFCFFLILYFLVCTALIGVVTVVIIFVIKPRRPIFTLQSIKLDSFNLNTSSSSSSSSTAAVYISSNVSLTLNAQNPNKVVGLRYGSSQLHVLYKGLPLGSVQVPQFYQPPHTKNVSVQTQVVFERVNMSLLLTNNSTTDNINDLQWKKKKKDESSSSRINNNDTNKRSLIDNKLRIVGDISIHVHAWFITFPKIKVVLDCEISVDYTKWFIISRHQMYSMKENKRVSRPTSNPYFSNKCSVAVYI